MLSKSAVTFTCALALFALGSCSTGGPNNGFTDSSVSCGSSGTACTTNEQCLDRSICNGQEFCHNGCCEHGTAMNCTSGFSCATGMCSEDMGGCVFRVNHAACPPAQRCVADRGCIDPSTVDCSENGDVACRVLGGNLCDGLFVCDAASHRCAATPAFQCDDHNVCTDDSCAVQQNVATCTNAPNVNMDTDPNNCGSCRHQCIAGQHESTDCMAGTCIYACAPGYVDANHNSLDGCECMGAIAGDPPDLSFTDSNCDGIDGDATNGVFVDVLTGSDDNSGTMAQPLQTIRAGMMLAASNTLKQVYVSLGTYAGPVRLIDGVSIFGGYDASNHWSRDLNNLTLIRSPNSQPAVAGDGITMNVEIQLFTIESRSAIPLGGSSYGTRLTNSTGLITLRGDTVQAGNGAVGIDGIDGLPGSHGGDGTPGVAGCAGCSNGGLAGQSGPSACLMLGGPGGVGGFGAASGTGGTSGTSSSGSGGSGGRGGTSGGCGLGGSSPGTDGGPGLPGMPGPNGMGIGVAARLSSAGDFLPATAGNGVGGLPGAGGGGGGGGGGGSDNGGMCFGDRAGGGGGGGGGGCPGQMGTGGSGGGGSFPVVVVNARVTIDSCALQAGRGGTGGTGGNGGTGGPGGNGGGPGPGAGTSAHGGPGGIGGEAGAGGSGSGGPGGPSLCVVYSGQAPTLTSTTTCTRGGGGDGGSGGSNLGAGMAGHGDPGVADVVFSL